MNSQTPIPPESTPEIEVVIEVDDDAVVPSTKDPPQPGRAPMVSRIGQLLSDRYRLDALIAEGGMGAVFRGEHVHMRKRVAIKLLRPETEQLPELVERFEREAIVGAHVDHPNVAAATDFGRLRDGSYFLVLEYVEGTTLRDRIRKGPITPDEAAGLARQIAEALGACHRMQVVHRDVKPANVMIEASSGRVKLVDFGLAKVPSSALGGVTSPDLPPLLAAADESDTQRSITLKGVVFGTVAYMSPEAEFGMAAVDHRADLYALGVILYEMLAGRHPFDAVPLPELFQLHKSAPPPPFAVRAPDRAVPPALEAIAMRLLAKRRGDRFADAAEVIAALDAAQNLGRAAAIVSEPTFEPVMGARTAPSLPGSVTPSVVDEVVKKRRAAPWIIAACVALLIGAAGVAPRGPERPTALGDAKAPAAVPAPAAVLPLARFGSVVAVAARAAVRAANRPVPMERSRAVVARRALHDAAEARAWARGSDALIELGAARADDLDATDIAPAASVALALAFAESPKTAATFDALARQLGSWGVDVLYDVASKHGGARAAKRADDLLADDEVRARATPALRAALALRAARCEDKPDAFATIARDGDERGLLLLERLRGVNCTASRCCYLKNRALESSIADTKARLAK